MLEIIFLIIYILVQISLLGTALGRFGQCSFFIFRRQPFMVAEIFTQPSSSPTTIKKLPTALKYNVLQTEVISSLLL